MVGLKGDYSPYPLCEESYANKGEGDDKDRVHCAVEQDRIRGSEACSSESAYKFELVSSRTLPMMYHLLPNIGWLNAKQTVHSLSR